MTDVFNIIDQETRRPVTLSVMGASDTIHCLANQNLLIARDGSECAIADSCIPIRHRDGKSVLGAVLLFRDVTQEYAAQEALHDSATRI
ncbi:MAG: two-component system sensor histidine kinase EvgS [Motiliproteus sp.]